MILFAEIISASVFLASYSEALVKVGTHTDLELCDLSYIASFQ